MPLLRVSPSSMVAGGAALAHEDSGRVVFVEGALPGETVLVEVVQARSDFARGQVAEVLEPSPDRVVPPCPTVLAGCGGCSWQHIAPEAQVRFKAGIVLDTLRRIGHLWAPPEPAVVPLAGTSLRTTARLTVSPGGRAGYRPRRDASRTVETDSCLAAHPLLEELITEGRYPGAEEVVARVGVASGERALRLRPGTATAAAGLTVPSGTQLDDGGAPPCIHERVSGLEFRVTIDSFFQPGPVAAAGLVAAVVEAVAAPPCAGASIPEDGMVVDAYGGVGLFGAVLGHRFAIPVTVVENDATAVADARINLAGVEGQVVAGDVAHWRPRRGDPPVRTMVADPPRSGLGKPGVGAVVASRTPRLVLVSCDPASLGRDAALLRAAGYHLMSLALVDAFPHTFHVETVSRFDLLPKD